MVGYALLAGGLSMGLISALSAFDGEIQDLLLNAGDAIRAMIG